jgi:ribosomal protein L14E/L6E/L27E
MKVSQQIDAEKCGCDSNVRSDTSRDRGNWNHVKIIQTIPEQHTGKARHQGTTENSHTELCTQTAESADVEVQNIQHGKQHYM